VTHRQHLAGIFTAFSGSPGEAATRGEAELRAAPLRRGASASERLADAAARHGQQLIIEPGMATNQARLRDDGCGSGMIAGACARQSRVVAVTDA
jgi:hypothetical protein